MINIDEMNEWCDDAVTHGLYVSECEPRHQAYYSGYLHRIKRDDLIDVHVNKDTLDVLSKYFIKDK
jgi:hypothetical protein